METDLTRIVGKIQKLLRLSGDAAASEGERENALRQAHALLAKHNLHMAEVEAAGQTPQEKRVDKHERVRNRPWTRTLADAVAALFFCRFFWSLAYDNNASFHFVGRESNVATAHAMFDYLVKSLRRECGKYSGRSSFRTGFYTGAADIIYARCLQLAREQQQAQSSGCTALVLASLYQLEDAANQKWMDAAGYNLKSATERHSTYSEESYAIGRKYGETVNLNQQLSNTTLNSRRLK